MIVHIQTSKPKSQKNHQSNLKIGFLDKALYSNVKNYYFVLRIPHEPKLIWTLFPPSFPYKQSITISEESGDTDKSIQYYHSIFLSSYIHHPLSHFFLFLFHPALYCCSPTALLQPPLLSVHCLFNRLPLRVPVQISSASSRCPDANFTADMLFYVIHGSSAQQLLPPSTPSFLFSLIYFKGAKCFFFFFLDDLCTFFLSLSVFLAFWLCSSVSNDLSQFLSNSNPGFYHPL